MTHYSVHLFEELVGGVLVAMVLHFVELSFFWGQHWVDLLRKRGVINKGNKNVHV